MGSFSPLAEIQSTKSLRPFYNLSMTKHYFFNTEAKSFGGVSPHDQWLAYGRACTSGRIIYGRILGLLEPGDVCFMYVNKKGVMAVGRVLKHWDGQAHNPPLIHRNDNRPEYQMEVDWYLTLLGNSISPTALRGVVGHTPRHAVERIHDHKAGQHLLAYAQRHADSNVPHLPAT